MAMLTFLFWNIGRRPLTASVARLANGHGADVLILAESDLDAGALLSALNRAGQDGFRKAYGAHQRIQVYTRFSARYLRSVQDSAHYTMRRLLLPLTDEVLVVAAHLPSQLHRDKASMDSVCREFGRAIRDVEGRVRHQRTVVVGDLNVDPYDDGVLAADGLHAVMTRERAARGARTVDGRTYPFFYNPMWGHFGDAHGTPPGTYHYARSQHVCRFWHMFDQVLVRPALLKEPDSLDVTVLSGDGARSFLRPDGVPDRATASDHLPLLFTLRL